MKKTLYLIALSVISALGQPMGAASMPFTHAGNDAGKITYFGKGEGERYDVAMPIRMVDLKGFKIKSIRAYFNADATPSTASIWVSDTLKNQRDITPSIINETVTPKDGEYAGVKMKMLEYTPAEPVVIDKLPVFVGYSIEIPEPRPKANKIPLALYDTYVPDGFQLHASQSIVRWTDYSTVLRKVPIIIVELEGDQSENSVQLSSINDGYAEMGTPANLTASIINTGASPVKSIKYSYSIDGSEEKMGTLEFNPPLVADPALPQIISPVIEGFESEGLQAVKMNVVEVNQSPNSSLHPEATGKIDVRQYLAMRKPLVEEYTGMWCGYCPQGYLSMEAAKERLDDRSVLICYHSGDALSPAGASYDEVSGFPSMLINREDLINAYYGTHDNIDLGVLIDIEENSLLPAEATIEVNDLTYEGSVLKFNVSVRNTIDKENADYRIGYVITEDDRSDPSYYQSNYYSGLVGYENTPLEFFTKASSTVFGLTYNDVAIDIENRFGVPDLLPASIKAGEWLDVPFTIDLSDNTLLKDYNNIGVAVILIEGEEGKVLNADKAYLTPKAGIEIPTLNAEILSSTYYTLDGRKVMNPGKGLYIIMHRLSDGSIKTEKRIFN